jgi:hypothetical protein
VYADRRTVSRVDMNVDAWKRGASGECLWFREYEVGTDIKLCNSRHVVYNGQKYTRIYFQSQNTYH